MIPRSPTAALPTHEVTNMSPPIGDQDLWGQDSAVREWAIIQGAANFSDQLAKAGLAAGADETFEKANQANRNGPELRAFDRYGMRINQVEFHPAYHDLMTLLISHRAHNFAWAHEGDGANVGQSVLTYLFSQAEGGAMCPMAMTYSVVPSLRTTPSLATEWMPRILSTEYDRRDIPVQEKSGALVGMFMTEKQGGSDVRANTTTAVAVGPPSGIGAEYHLTGHKFFCSAPMCDAFLVLAYTDGGLSCFLVPRWRPDGHRNGLFLQRIKDKLGNRSNASTEMEFQDTYGVMVGEEGRGVRTIVDMVTGNRIYCAMSSAGLMRQALVQAIHHAAHRSAFQKRLIHQPLMQNVLADLAVEVEGALALGLRVSRAMDKADNDPAEAALARIGTAVAKYWNCKRAPSHIFEALECLGGPGFIEDTILPRLYREAPVNSIWEGSGNIMGLDVLRALTREPEVAVALFEELEIARGNDANLDRSIDDLRLELENPKELESRMRGITEQMALAWQGALLTEHAPAAVAQAFCASRLAPRYRGAFGTLPAGCDFQSIIDRAWPSHAAHCS